MDDAKNRNRSGQPRKKLRSTVVGEVRVAGEHMCVVVAGRPVSTSRGARKLVTLSCTLSGHRMRRASRRVTKGTFTLKKPEKLLWKIQKYFRKRKLPNFRYLGSSHCLLSLQISLVRIVLNWPPSKLTNNGCRRRRRRRRMHQICAQREVRRETRLGVDRISAN